MGLGGGDRSNGEAAADRPTVLVIDDEPLVLRVIARSLASHFDVVTATSASEGLERIVSERFDVIVSDVLMPGMWGGELYAAVAERAPEACGRMIFLTGGSAHDEVGAFLSGLTNPHLDKPFGADELEHAIRQVLKRHASPR